MLAPKHFLAYPFPFSKRIVFLFILFIYFLFSFGQKKKKKEQLIISPLYKQDDSAVLLKYDLLCGHVSASISGSNVGLNARFTSNIIGVLRT